MARNTGPDRQTVPPQTMCSGLPQPLHHALGPGPRGAPCHPGPICPGEGRQGREPRGPGQWGRWSPGAGADKQDQEWLIPFLVLCWLWRDFLGLGGSRAGLLGGLGRQGHGGLFPGGSGGGCGGGRSGWGWEGPCCCRGLGHGGSCCRGLTAHAKLVHPCGVDAVDPPLVEVDEEDHIWGRGEGVSVKGRGPPGPSILWGWAGVVLQ